MKQMLAVVFFLVATFVYADVTATPVVVLHGDASTYNPNYAGWKTGGQSLATGGTYNPNGWEAALQLDAAKQYGCGYGSGKTCKALVKEPGGRAVILLINDNGPLVSGRIIDLNEKSMSYLSYEKYGRNSGVIKNVTVALLHGDQPLGPIDEKDRAEWLNKVFNAPVGQGNPATTGYTANTGVNGSPYTGGSQQGYSSQSGQSSSGSSGNTAYGAQGTSGTSGTNGSSGSSGTGASTPVVVVLPITPIGFLFKRFVSVVLPGSQWISWGVVGSADNCSVSVTSPTASTQVIAQGRSGTAQYGIPSDAPKGTWTVSLACSGFNKSDSFIVK